MLLDSQFRVLIYLFLNTFFSLIKLLKASGSKHGSGQLGAFISPRGEHIISWG